MIARLFQLLGLASQPARKPASRQARRGGSATAHLFEKKPASTRQKPQQTAADNGFNPYNTGQFDRSASWDRISKNQR